MDISFKIRQLLKSNDVSQKQLAGEIGFSVPAFNNALKRNDFKTSTLIKIADFFNVPVAYFFNDKNVLTEHEYHVQLKEQRVYYETIIDEREKGIVLYYSLAKAFLKIIYYFLSKKITSEGINIEEFKDIAKRFFSIDIKKLYQLHTTESTDDFAIWFKNLTNKDVDKKELLDLDKLFE